MKPDDIILDFFAGSATTAHAVMKWNSEHEVQYRHIMVQLPENLDTSVSSQKVTYEYLRKIGRNGMLDEVGQERIIRAAGKIKEEHPDTNADLGFQHYTLKTIDEPTLDKLQKFDNSGFVTDRTVYELFGTNTILTTWLIHDGYTFTNKCQRIHLAGYVAYWCENHLYLIEPDMDEEAVKALIDRYNSDGSFNPQNIVVFGYSFHFVNMENLKTNVKILRDSAKNLKVNLDIRY